jgi:hypothetical protein
MGFLFFPGFFTRSSPGPDVNLQIIVLISIFTLSIAAGFWSYHPLRGFTFSIFIAILFLFGHLSSYIVSLALTQSGAISSAMLDIRTLNLTQIEQQHLLFNAHSTISANLSSYLSFGPKGQLISIFSAVLGLASLGFLSGLIGYIFKNLSPLAAESYPLVFRDYWSQIRGFRKSRSQEYPDWDRRLAGWSIQKGSWLQRIRRKVREPRQELIFVDKGKVEVSSAGITRGELYDVSSGRMLGEFVNYNDLISKYLPKLIHDPCDTINMVPAGEVLCTPPAFRGLIERITSDVVKSRYTLLFFAIPTLILAFYPLASILITHASIFPGRPITFNWAWLELIAVTAIPSILAFLLIFGFWKKSRQLVERRPDERGLVLAIFLCLLLAYPIVWWIFTNYPEPINLTIPSSWALSWLWGWTVPFLTLSAILGFSYIFIHRETETINTYLFDNRTSTMENAHLQPFKDTEEIPWIKSDKQTEFFWVIRFIYYWPAEVTIPKPHIDWERVELWADAKTGVLKWVVSDYHYREVWYKIKDPYEKPLPDLFVKIWPNFHTPIPIVDFHEAKNYYNAVNASKKELSKNMLMGIKLRFSQEYKKQKKNAANSEMQRTDAIDRLIEEQGAGFISRVLQKLKCDEIRYIKGVECTNKETNRPLYETESSCA